MSSLVTYGATPLGIAREMLHMAQVSSEDVVCDLGCGDGRILIMAVQEFGAKKAVGYELRQDLYESSQWEIQHERLKNQVTIIRGDLLDADLSQASVIILYLSNKANEVLRPKLEKEAKPGTRIVSHFFSINTWRPAREVHMKVPLDSYSCDEGWFRATLYLYLIPQAFQSDLI